MNKLKTRGQNLSEFALCLTIIITVIMAMRLYVQRSLQARYKDGVGYLFSEIRSDARARNLSNLTNINEQYDPYYQESNTTEIKDSNLTKGFPRSSTDETTIRSGWQRIGPAE